MNLIVTPFHCPNLVVCQRAAGGVKGGWPTKGEEHDDLVVVVVSAIARSLAGSRWPYRPEHAACEAGSGRREGRSQAVQRRVATFAGDGATAGHSVDGPPLCVSIDENAVRREQGQQVPTTKAAKAAAAKAEMKEEVIRKAFEEL